MPPAVVWIHEFAGGVALVIEQAGDQPPRLVPHDAVGEGDGDPGPGSQQAPRVGQFTFVLGTEAGGQHHPGAALDHYPQTQQRGAQLQRIPHALRVTPGDLLVVGRVQVGALQRHRAQPR